MPRVHFNIILTFKLLQDEEKDYKHKKSKKKLEKNIQSFLGDSGFASGNSIILPLTAESTISELPESFLVTYGRIKEIGYISVVL